MERKAGIRSYTVGTEGGEEYRRNRKHMRETKEAFEDSVIEDDFMQDSPAEGEEGVESGTNATWNGKSNQEQPQIRQKSDSNPGKTATNIIVHIKFFRKGKV